MSSFDVERNYVQILYKIHNFSACRSYRPGEYFDSGYFKFRNSSLGSGTPWWVRVYPNDLKYYYDYLCVYLVRGDVPQYVLGPVTLDLEYALLDDTNERFVVRKTSVRINAGEPRHLKNPKIDLVSDVFRFEECLPGDVLTVRCRVYSSAIRNTENILIHSHIQTRKCCFEWPISGFENEECISKIPIPIEVLPDLFPKNTKFYLSYRNKNGAEKIEFEISNPATKMIFCNCKIILLDFQRVYLNDDKQIKNGAKKWVVKTFKKREEILKCKQNLENGTLNLMCHFSIVDRDMKTVVDHKTPVFQTEISSDQDEKVVPEQLYKKFYKEGLLTDVILAVQGTHFYAHKLVLAAGSDFFKRMFLEDITIRQIQITNLDKETVSGMLDYFYDPTKIPVDYEKLYDAACKYQVIFLKRRTTEILTKYLDLAQNPLAILHLADHHKDSYLKNYVIDFICSRKNRPLSAEIWKCLMQQNSNLAAELASKMTQDYKDSDDDF